jgi:hypothetical protein
LLDEQEISENLSKNIEIFQSKTIVIYIQRTNKRILVFAVPIEFIAVQPIE